MKKRTEVFLVGAGPGDPGLLTVKGLDCIRRADCIIYDKLLNDSLLAQAGPDCVRIFAGKSAGSHSMRQEEINALLLDCAARYEIVVRLKGGDPYVFGRGGEEALCLRAAGVPFRIVPGVSSAVAGLAYAGIPVTHRGLATAFHVITAHTRESDWGINYVNLAHLDGTLVFLMGLARVGEICRGLLSGGMPPETPAAVVSQATRSGQRTVTAPLAGLPEAMAAADLPAPAMVVVGGVVALREALNFFEELPLFGQRLLVTRAGGQSGGLSALLEDLGAETVCAPMLELRPIPGALDGPLARLDSYSHIVFTSRNGVDFFFRALFAAGSDARALGGARLCTVGRATAAALGQYGLRADLVPETAQSEALLALLQAHLQPSDRVLLPQSRAARPLLREGLQAICSLDAVDLYDSLPAAADGERLRAMLAGGEITGAVFTSSAAAEQFHLAVGADALAGVPCYSIGPVTSGTLRTLGLTPVESDEATLAGLAACIRGHIETDMRCGK